MHKNTYILWFSTLSTKLSVDKIVHKFIHTWKINKNVDILRRYENLPRFINIKKPHNKAIITTINTFPQLWKNTLSNL